jgi:hypothetical protein
MLWIVREQSDEGNSRCAAGAFTRHVQYAWEAIAKQQFLAEAGVECGRSSMAGGLDQAAGRFVAIRRLVADCHHALWVHELYWQQQSPLLLSNPD